MSALKYQLFQSTAIKKNVRLGLGEIGNAVEWTDMLVDVDRQEQGENGSGSVENAGSVGIRRDKVDMVFERGMGSWGRSGNEEVGEAVVLLMERGGIEHGIVILAMVVGEMGVVLV